MKFKQMKGYEQYSKMPEDILSAILKARGVEDVDALMNVSDKDVHDPMLMKNMQKGIDLIKKHKKLESKVNILIDEDSDGYTSASLMFNYLTKNFPNLQLTFTTNEDKQHGIKLHRFKDLDFNLLIVPDAGSGDFKEHRILKEKGIDVLIVDHHPISEESRDAIVINPNLFNCHYPNKHLSGVGVAYKFCKALDIEKGFNDADNYLDLVALGMIADSMDLRSHETRYLCLKGIEMMNEMRERIENGQEKIGNPFINAIIDKKKERDLEHINFHAIDWKISPQINGCIRSGTEEEKINMFRAFIGDEELIPYQPRRKVKTDPKPDIVMMTLQEDMVRQITNIKARQDKEVKSAMEVIEQRIADKNLLDNKIIFVDGTGCIENKSLSGLIAQKIASKYCKPCLILKKRDDDNYGGSARNYSSMSIIEDLKSTLVETGMFNKEQKDMGHPNAFGISIKTDNLVEARDILNEKFKNTEFELMYNVDFIINFGRLKKQDILKIGKLKSVWGNTIPCPRFAITNLKMPVSEIELIGEKENIIRFKKNDLTFIKFFSNKDLYNSMIMRNETGFGKSPKEVMLDLIVEFEINTWEGVDYPQMNIVDFNVNTTKEPLF